MRFIPVTRDQRAFMLGVIGSSCVDELFDAVPDSVVLDRDLALPNGVSEMELVDHVRGLAARNTPASSLVSFAGAGCYDHHVPSVVDHVLRRPEFFTAYTPYQPEVSQGTLQAVWEYQTMACELLGMEVANASMYDGATAFVEAALMACRVTGRDRVVVSGNVHPEWVETLRTYSAAGVMSVDVVPVDGGTTGAGWLSGVRDDTAAVLLACPDFHGTLTDVREHADAAHAAGALAVVAADPVLLGVLEPPGALGADIVVAEGQSLGGAMNFGGPGLGMFACREEHVRQMPGRLVGRTIDADGNTGFVLTFSTREQHIRRGRATSNICSNHSLNALGAGVYLAAVGGEGLAGIARACVAKAHHLRERLLATGRFTAPWEAPFGYEFALRYDGDAAAMQAEMLRRGYLAGVLAEGGLVVFAVTERRVRAEIDAFAGEVASL